MSELSKEFKVAPCLFIVLGELIVQVEAIETVVFQKAHRRGYKFGAK